MFLIKRIISLGVAFILSATFSYILISSHNTLWNLFWLKTQNFDISFLIIYSSLMHDIKGFLSPVIVQWGIPISFYTIICATLLIAFMITAIVRIILPINSKFSYGIAGFSSIYVMNMLITMRYDGITLISSARENFGLITLCLIGFLGGFLFDFLVSKLMRRGS